MFGSEISEAEQYNSMPAWKRDILERRKAKSGGAAESCSSAVAARVNDEVHGVEDNSKNSEFVTSTISNRNYKITSASRHFAGKRIFTPTCPELSPFKTNKYPTSAFDHCDITTPGVRCSRDQESSVLLDSLGPLQDNLFIKLERQRRKRRDQEKAARSIQHILELYGSVPGIRTIRADNIIIIESDPDYFPEPRDSKTGTKLQQNGNYSALKDLLDKKGAVTEIYAKEVVIFNSVQSKSEDNLSTLGHRSPYGELERVQRQGRVSRLLQKFDHNYDKLQPRSRSSDNLLDIDTSPGRLRPQAKPQLDLVPKSVTPPRSTSPAFSPDQLQTHLVFQNSESSQFRLQTLSSVEKQESGIPITGSPQSASLFNQHFEEGGERSTPVNSRKGVERSQAEPLRERDSIVTDGCSKPKVPSSLERPRDVHGGTSPRQLPHSPTFEIRPSPRPDLSALPPDDVQARALANLRLQSRNSFTVIPKRVRPAVPSDRAVPSSDRAVTSDPIKPAPSLGPHHRATETQPTEVPKPTPPASPPPSSSSLKVQEESPVPRQALTEPPEPHPLNPYASPSPSVEVTAEPPVQVELPPSIDQLPVTNIDDVVVEHPQAATSPVVFHRKGNTFTVVPKRRPDPESGSPEPQDPAVDQKAAAQAPKQAPYAELGSLLKKRYPKAEEIEVVGGYLSLSRSCLSKTSGRKKLKISFNESSLHDTFEYPSESSLWDGGEGENEEEEEEEEEDGDNGPKRFLIPRASYKGSPTHTSNSIDLSNYTPKHSVDFSAWQDLNHDDHVFPGDSNAECTELSLEEVMLTPADSSSHSAFRSEPALYF
ncbi:hypothetical protein AAFF_G00424470 [Aldrovandia affinis]|uniref:Taperin n=1 Tax=Aldrovandia affinis TaxID=143900 RepID=A0AAD7X002_9TELE|nr:hypothetical protein AAFF_G00424470 [Aldrovandia affinis]